MREIILVYDNCIDSIRVIYDKHGKIVAGEKHGGVGGNKTAEVFAFRFSISFNISMLNNVRLLSGLRFS